MGKRGPKKIYPSGRSYQPKSIGVKDREYVELHQAKQKEEEEQGEEITWGLFLLDLLYLARSKGEEK